MLCFSCVTAAFQGDASNVMSLIQIVPAPSKRTPYCSMSASAGTSSVVAYLNQPDVSRTGRSCLLETSTYRLPPSHPPCELNESLRPGSAAGWNSPDFAKRPAPPATSCDLIIADTRTRLPRY